eukprot:TRINITY_DN24685_c0_g1_i1.p1 TRINITY_DN24685_c0_g1~~TRINITY_DN24685_c0_g1_i1.p1  ORF type:complete len:365 (+),score=62.72 TRINITY_DN24685_c0_g1_i1:79-1173(+)
MRQDEQEVAKRIPMPERLLSKDRAMKFERRHARSDFAADPVDDSDSEDLEATLMVGPSPSKAVRTILDKKISACGAMPGSSSAVRARCARGSLSHETFVCLSDIQILKKLPGCLSFGSALHLRENCTELCQVCSFSRKTRTCKKSWLCDFCHMQPAQSRPRKKGSGAFQVSQLGDETVLCMYQEMEAENKMSKDTHVRHQSRNFGTPRHQRQLHHRHHQQDSGLQTEWQSVQGRQSQVDAQMQARFLNSQHRMHVQQQLQEREHQQSTFSLQGQLQEMQNRQKLVELQLQLEELQMQLQQSQQQRQWQQSQSSRAYPQAASAHVLEPATPSYPAYKALRVPANLPDPPPIPREANDTLSFDLML